MYKVITVLEIYILKMKYLQIGTGLCSAPPGEARVWETFSISLPILKCC